MQDADHHHDGSIRAGAEALRGSGVGLVVATVGLGVVTVLGILPAGTAGFAWGGLGLAAILTMLAAWFQARQTSVPGEDPHASRRFILGLTVPFLALALTAAGGVLALSLSDVKFEAIAAFALTFAAVAMILHTAGMLALARALRARAAAAGATAGMRQ